MLLLRTGWTGTQKGAIKHMNTYATFAVNDHLQVLLDEAAARRAFSIEKPSLSERIASAASSVKSTLSTPADYSRSILPTLDDYPYRG